MSKGFSVLGDHVFSMRGNRQRVIIIMGVEDVGKKRGRKMGPGLFND